MFVLTSFNRDYKVHTFTTLWKMIESWLGSPVVRLHNPSVDEIVYCKGSMELTAHNLKELLDDYRDIAVESRRLKDGSLYKLSIRRTK